MMGAEWSNRTAVVLVAAAFALAIAGCASSSQQENQESASEKTEELDQEKSKGSSSAEEGDRGERGRMEVRKQVHFEEILGKEVRGDTPPGCTGEWSPLESTSFPGDGYTCTKFNGPDEWENIPVTMVVKEGRLAVIVLQRFFDGPDGARGAYDDLTGKLLDRCERKTGFNRSIVLNCEDYFADVRWRPGHDRATLKVIYATSWEILKQGR